MKKGEINGEWHKANIMPQNPTRAERVEWHAEHALACGCRPVPATLAAEVAGLNEKRSSRRSN